MKVLDLFSGIGGFSLGLERAGFKTVAFCEIEPYCQKVLRKHWPDVPIYEDVRNVTAERLRADGIFPDIVTGGFPCQDISIAGKQAGIDGERSGLWTELARVISEVQPRYAILENVTALISGDRGRWFGRVLGDLAEIGYDAEWHCIPASELGAHHHRDRVWIIAYPSGQRGERLQCKLAELIGCRQGWETDEENFDNDAPNALRERQSRQGRAKQSRDKAETTDWKINRAVYAFRWPTKPPVQRGVDGVSRRLDKNRLTCIGNAVVPQIPEIIGRAIIEHENR